MIHPEILPKPVPIYDGEDSMIPERLRVSFEDGRTEIYQLNVRRHRWSKASRSFGR